MSDQKDIDALTEAIRSNPHVDEFIDNSYSGRSKSVRYARFVLLLMRLPTPLSLDFAEWTEQFKLFCTYKGKTYRVTGCSRLGDVWLAEDFERDCGYDKRVLHTECSNWSPTPES